MDVGDSGQTVLLATPANELKSSFCAPFVVVNAGIVLAVLVIALRLYLSRDTGLVSDSDRGSKGLAGRIRRHVSRVGGPAILTYKVARCAVLVSLLALVAITSHRDGWVPYSIILTEALVFTAALSVANVLVSARTAQVFSPFLTLFALGIFANYAYRDIWPLMTFTLRPVDAAEGRVLWVKVALATWAGLLGPLFEPWPYIPVYPEHPKETPHPEQTASFASWIYYVFLDSLVWHAYRVPHLSYDQLPPLADYDEAQYLIEQHFRHLDPFSGAKKGSLLWPILRIIRRPLVHQALCTIITALARLAGPVGINELLKYLERGEEGSFVRPWVWILWVALGPITVTLFGELSLWSSTRSLIRVEAILTTLIYDHALRLRNKADAGTKTKQAPESESAKGDATKQNASGNTVGRIMNLASSDMNNITGGRNFLGLFLGVPLNVTLSLWFLYSMLGWSSLVGFAVMVALLPVPGRLAAFMSGAQKDRMRASDGRVQLVTEMLNVLRMIKLFGWEKRAEQEIAEKRSEELKWVWKSNLYSLVIFNINRVLPLWHMIATYAVYTMVMKRSLNASIVFSTMGVFGTMRNQLHWVSNQLPTVINSYVSMNRLRDFLWDTELLDSFTEVSDDLETVALAHEHDIGLGSSDFSWAAGAASSTASQPSFRLHIEDDVVFKRGHFNLVIGPTGCGKTSVLMALLGEMHRIPLSPGSWANLPREHGVAYAAQESWVLSDTIKENILFGSPYDEQRYKKVIRQCALTKDLAMFDSGDETQVGEKGITLSGGQNARVTLARAVYSSAEILLLDDVLAALDVHTARWVVNECFLGDLMKGRTIILVTHNIALTAPLAKFILSLNADGSVRSKGTAVDVLGRDPELAKEVEHEAEAMELDADGDSAEGAAPVNPEKGKLIIPEEIALGRVGKSAYKLYLSAMGGVIYWLAYTSTEGSANALNILSKWWLGWWAAQYAVTSPRDVDVVYYLAVYCLLILMMTMCQLVQSLVDANGRIKASRTIHEKLVLSIFGTTFRWLDVTPTSRIITRCTQDIQATDEAVPRSINVVASICIVLVSRVFVLVAWAPVFLLPCIAVIGFGVWIGTVYIKAQLSVKREMSNRKAPVLAMFGSAIQGLVSVRAYSAQAAFREQLLKRVNEYTRVGRTFWLLNRWVAVRIDTLSAIFAAAVSSYFVYVAAVDPSTVGFILVLTTSFTTLVMDLVHWLNVMEVNANSLERLQQYIHIPQEPKGGMQPPAYWPSSGNLHVERLSASYTPDGPKILQDLSFELKSGERVGVVGRTGAGKSTLTLALLRCIHTEGVVMFDGVRTDSITLDALRSSVTIIPQTPELMGGTLRHNLDPFGQYDDATLNDALRSAGLFSLQETSEENRITLDTNIAGSGANLSVGQRQIIALARAIVRQSKLLILDEATSAIDYNTDAVIQQSLRTELRSDVTVITVAHRLQTIMDYDKIMVLDAGRLVEFDTPRALLQKKDGLLYTLVEQSADKDQLYAAAHGKQRR